MSNIEDKFNDVSATSGVGADEFKCSKCQLVRHLGQVAKNTASGPVCEDCASTSAPAAPAVGVKTSAVMKAADFLEPYHDADVSTLTAKAQEIDGEFFVLKGSQVKRVSSSTFNYTKLRNYLIENEIIDSKDFTFNQDYLFSSPSAASGVIQGRSSNGRKEWKEINTHLTYAEWQQKQVDSA